MQEDIMSYRLPRKAYNKHKTQFEEYKIQVLYAMVLMTLGCIMTLLVLVILTMVAIIVFVQYETTMMLDPMRHSLNYF